MSYAAEVLADSPVVWYRQGDASGTTMTDSSGNGRDATYVGSPTLGAAGVLVGDSDTAVVYNGSSSYAQANSGSAADTALKAMGTSFTLEVWTKLVSNSGQQAWIDRYGNGAAGVSAYIFYLVSGKPRFILRNTSDVDANCDATSTLTAGSWYHLVATYDGTNAKVYVNGTLEKTTAIAAISGFQARSPVLRLAQSIVGGANGTMDEVAIYNTALSAARIAAHYNTGLGLQSAAVTMAGAGTLTAGADTLPSIRLAGAGTLAAVADTLPPIRMNGVGTLAVAGTVIDVVELGTDTSNFYDGRSRDGLGLLEVFTPYVPPTVPAPVRVEKARALPDPVLVNGRPT